MKLIWTERALAALEQIGEHIARDNPGAAQRWLARLVRRAEDATLNPLSGRVVPELAREDIREMIEKKYRIVYQVKERAVFVLFVFEGHHLLVPSEVEPEDD